MTDYKEEQTNEIEALESIYPDEFEILETDPQHKFKISVKSEGSEPYADLTVEAAEITLHFEYTSTYPDEPPVMEVVPVENIEDEELEGLRRELLTQCEENLGMVMVFTLVSYSLEWLTNHMESIARSAKEELEKEKLELEEAERKKFEGTRVSVETFLAWKAKFDAEMNYLRTDDKDDEKNKKLTGRELFMRDKTLNESDLSFLGEGETEVTVDESLFQDLDDLDFEDDDDVDYLPGVDDEISE